MKISFQIRHPEENLEIAGKKLGISPFRIWEAGHQRETPKGKELEGKYDQSYCCLRLENKEGVCGSGLIVEFLDKLESDQKYWSDLLLSGGKFSLVVFRESDKGNCVDEFDWRLLGRLSKLNISLGFDV